MAVAEDRGASAECTVSGTGFPACHLFRSTSQKGQAGKPVPLKDSEVLRSDYALLTCKVAGPTDLRISEPAEGRVEGSRGARLRSG
jgi:hypothetical protein